MTDSAESLITILRLYISKVRREPAIPEVLDLLDDIEFVLDQWRKRNPT
jgi:hypothetical protein